MDPDYRPEDTESHLVPEERVEVEKWRRIDDQRKRDEEKGRVHRSVWYVVFVALVVVLFARQEQTINRVEAEVKAREASQAEIVDHQIEALEFQTRLNAYQFCTQANHTNSRLRILAFDLVSEDGEISPGEQETLDVVNRVVPDLDCPPEPQR